MMGRLVVSFSLGETSAYMAKLVSDGMLPEYDEVIFICANTGQEHEKSLEFGDYVNKKFLGGRLVWVEAIVRHNARESCGHRVVSFDTAHRGSNIFEDMARKYGIPNQSFPHCTRSLKLEPINSYLRSVGWEKGSYDTAIGIRCDEIDRVSVSAKENNIIYPLVNRFPMRKVDINEFWENQPRRLDISGYEGNCVWCWKKTLRKHYTIIQDDQSIYDVPDMLERRYGMHGSNKTGEPRVMFRGNRSTKDLINGSKDPFVRYHDENRVYDNQLKIPFDDILDVGGGCGESCEIYSDE